MKPLRIVPTEDPEDRGYRAADDTFSQAIEARDRLMLPAEAFLHLPWPNLDGLVGGMAPGDVWFLAGFSGNGKTMFLMNLVELYLAQGRTVYYLGLETQPLVLRTHLLCLRLGLFPGDVLSGASREWPDWLERRAELIGALERHRSMGERDRFLVNGVTHVNETALRAAGRDAALDRSDLVVIDHVDHLRHEGGRGMFDESVRVVNLILELAQDKQLRFLVATQCNNNSARGDRLGQYQPPQVADVYMGPQKRMIATGMIGLFRPLDPDAGKDVMADVRSGRREVGAVLQKNTMGLTIMKHRYYGNREGQRTTLAVEHGRLLPTEPRDQYSTAHGARNPL